MMLTANEEYASYDLYKLLDEFDERKLEVPVIVNEGELQGFNKYCTLYKFSGRDRVTKIGCVSHSLGDATESIYKAVLNKINFLEKLKEIK